MILRRLLILALLGFAALLLYGYARDNPEDLPWTRLDLTQPIGAFTGRKLAELGGEGARCKALLDQAGVGYSALPPRRDGPQCGHDEAVRLRTDGALDISYRPPGLGTSCPVGAALALWEWHIVQPAALRHFGRKVASIDHFGSYSCRRLYGRSEGGWSEHARANAVDIAGFRLEGGERITVAGDWDSEDAKGRFLREVRDGACRLFATTLSPDYNQAHHDHLHLDQASRGATGWRGCR
ncbi:extensin-like domain-containing protein [Sphingosinicella rhizophila]|uniref:Extensin family protein n=1 Tax=Sphingosinicella rhizophila TaxID=3050082 RepID=A0ABU3Q413_9SPHN|nr:extensin family protein [Sphingosinicella sp. GR2756]MDT9598156.1 extensin family protein [Sphingosinicella sp. GR2756]